MSNNVYVAKENNPSLTHVDRINGKVYECHLVMAGMSRFHVYVCNNETHIWESVKMVQTEYVYVAKKAFRRYVTRIHRIAYQRRDRVLLQRYNSYATERSSEQFANEHSDCTVVTLSTVAGISYSEAHKIAKSAGRKEGRGMKMARLLEKAQQLGVLKFVALGRPRQTVATFCKKNPVGRFVVAVPKHALTVIDGKCIDLQNSLTRRVKNVWLVKCLQHEEISQAQDQGAA